MYSLNQIEKTLQNFVNAHQLLNSYGFGELADVAQGAIFGTVLTGMFAFLLGSSQGSRAKDQKK